MILKNKYSWIILLIFTACLSGAYAQDSTLTAINQHRLQINKTGMWVLGSWAVANIASGAVLRGQTSGSTQYFYEMNMFWNVINLGLAGAGLYGSYTADPASFDLWGTFQEQQNIEKILLFNAALDLGYMAGGAYLMERSRRVDNKPERLKGYGRSLILQGGFLLVFDATLFWIHHRAATPQLKELLSHVAFTGNGLAITWQF